MILWNGVYDGGNVGSGEVGEDGGILFYQVGLCALQSQHLQSTNTSWKNLIVVWNIWTSTSTMICLTWLVEKIRPGVLPAVGSILDKKNGNDNNDDNAMVIAMMMTMIWFHSFGTFWTSSTGNWWEITEVGRLRCFIEFFAHFTFLTPFVHLKQVLL